MYRDLFKPIFNICFSLLGFIVLLPLFLIVMVLLAIANKGSIFFVQSRPGKNGRIFKLIKFKTMNDARNETGDLLPDAQRLTPVGKFVRATSLDEIPQLLNVIKGDMSLVGPRPLLVEYLPLYSAEQARRHEVRPGITGWAQVNGRNAISWQKKFELDVWYVDNISLFLDLRIFIKTIKNVLHREGIYKDGDINSMEAFNGNN